MSCSTCPAKALLDNIPENSKLNTSSCGKLSTHDWLKDIPMSNGLSKLTEVRFKNTRKGFYINENELPLKRGDYVAVEGERGHDIGQITLTGKLAEMQAKRKPLKEPPSKKVYRKATRADIEKWQKARLREKPVMTKARQLANSLNLEMKISDVEFQGDGSKAIFYYIADGRVDFRELIKKYAKEFSVKIEMKQIGSRQEAALVGGIGSCGNELCCSSWRTNLDTVLTSAAKVQELSHNAQKLTGQCGKLKCCLMYELDTYLEAQSDFPDELLELETDAGIAYPKKKDILRKIIYYAVGSENSSTLVPVDLEKVKEIIQLNKKGIKAEKLGDEKSVSEPDLEFISHQEKDLDSITTKNQNKKPEKQVRKKKKFRSHRKK